MDLIIVLKELKETLSRRRNDTNHSKKLNEFESLISSTQSTDDYEYCMSLYKSKNLTKAYKSLKYRMEERLVNDIIFLASEEANLKSRVNANLVIGKLYYLSSILMKNIYRKQAIPLYERCYHLSEKFHYFNYALQCGEVLANHYGFVDVDNKKMHFYLNRNKELVSIIEAENYVRECNTLFSNIYTTKKGYMDKSNLDFLKERVENMQILKKKFKTYIIINFTNDLTFYYYQTIKEYSKALEMANIALEEIQDKNDKFLIFQTYKNIGIAQFMLHNYTKSLEWFLKAKEIPNDRSLYWFHITSYLYLNQVHLSEYIQLYKLTRDVFLNKHLPKFPYFHEQWIVREAFLHFLIRGGKVELTSEEKKSLKPFVLSRFLNSVPLHSKDKSGQNVSIIVVQILYLLLDKKYDKIIDKIDSLTQYTYRYLKNDDTFRSNCFIKMLLKMVAADFHALRTKTYTADLYKKLKSTQLITDETNPHVEIIPYDYLWEVILEILSKSK